MTKWRCNRERRHKREIKYKRIRAIKGRGKINNFSSVTTIESLKNCRFYSTSKCYLLFEILKQEKRDEEDQRVGGEKKMEQKRLEREKTMKGEKKEQGQT